MNQSPVGFTVKTRENPEESPVDCFCKGLRNVRQGIENVKRKEI